MAKRNGHDSQNGGDRCKDIDAVPTRWRMSQSSGRMIDSTWNTRWPAGRLVYTASVLVPASIQWLSTPSRR